MNNTLNKIGLSTAKSEKLAEKLNILLANYQIFYLNTRGFHWNIRGKKFFELHEKFEELYNDSKVKIDEIAERILTLGYTPLHSFSHYTIIAKVEEAKNVSDGTKAIQNILETYETILPLEREILELSDSSNDEGTNSMMSDYIREQEKLIWMYSAFLNEN